MDAYIIDAWMRRDDREDDDAYEGRMNLGPPNNVAAAVEHENQQNWQPKQQHELQRITDKAGNIRRQSGDRKEYQQTCFASIGRSNRILSGAAPYAKCHYARSKEEL